MRLKRLIRITDHSLVERPRGSIAVWAALCLMPMLAFVAFSVDLGYIVLTEAELQNAADMGALSGARALRYGGDPIEVSQTWAGKNDAAGTAVNEVDVEVGIWDKHSKTLVVPPAGGSISGNAVRVTCFRTAARGNSLNLFFAKIFGTHYADLSATATAILPPAEMGTRFLIDDEMIDTDVLAIEQLASATGRSPDDLLRARGFNYGKNYGSGSWTWKDNFLDIPADVTMSLPTGQGTSYDNNDSGLFDITHSAFPFTDQDSFRDFLMYSETGGDTTKWGTDNSAIKNKLDPLEGIAPVTDSSRYPSFVDPDFVHVSPVFSSDVNTLNRSDNNPRVNALGIRRGLIAFKIIAVGSDIDGSGSVLPQLIIKTVDPSTIDSTNLNAIDSRGSSNGSTILVD